MTGPLACDGCGANTFRVFLSATFAASGGLVLECAICAARIGFRASGPVMVDAS